MTSLETYIRSSVPVSPHDMQTITSHFHEIELKKGEYYLKKGRLCDKLGFIQNGYVRVFIEANDREITQWISPPGYFITDLSSFILQHEVRWNMQALTDCTLYDINRADYDKLSKALPLWKDLDRLFIVKCFSLMEERIFNQIHMSSEERFQHLMHTQPELFNVVPLQYLASMLGMTPETLSRLRRKLL